MAISWTGQKVKKQHLEVRKTKIYTRSVDNIRYDTNAHSTLFLLGVCVCVCSMTFASFHSFAHINIHAPKKKVKKELERRELESGDETHVHWQRKMSPFDSLRFFSYTIK